MAQPRTASNTRSSSRKKMASSFREEALPEALFGLRKSLAGYVSAMTWACRQIDPLLVDYGNLASVESLQASLDKTWNNYQESTARYRSLVDENSLEIHEVNDQYAPQELRKHHFDQRIREFTIAAATHFNGQVSRDLSNTGLASPASPEITTVTPSFVVPAVFTQASTLPVTPRRVCTFPAAHERAYGDPSLPTRVNTFPTVDTRGHANSTLTTRDITARQLPLMVSPFRRLQACLHSPNWVRASSHVFFYRRHSSYAYQISSRDFARFFIPRQTCHVFRGI